MGNPNLLPYETIVRATSGEPEDVDEVLRHYSKRIRIAAIENGHIDRDTEDSIKKRLAVPCSSSVLMNSHTPKLNNRRYIGRHTKTGNQQKVSFFCAHFWHFSKASIMAGLDEKFKSMIGEQLDIQGKLKPVERRLGTLKKHLEQADIYFKCKGKKPLTEAEQILFTTAKDYLKGIMNGKTTIPTKTWKEEYTKLTAERKTLNQRYLALKEEVKEAEKIRKSVYSILRQEQREQQPRRKQDMER